MKKVAGFGASINKGKRVGSLLGTSTIADFNNQLDYNAAMDQVIGIMEKVFKNVNATHFESPKIMIKKQ